MFGSWFRKSQEKSNANLWVDMHSHLLPGLDDGSPDIETSLTLIKAMANRGFKKLITTPHIMGDFYRNSPDNILPALHLLNESLKSEQINIELQAAAEYYLDELLMDALDQDKQLLTFGNQYLLFETNFLSEPLFLKEFVFKLSTKGYKPILAHPERYMYLYKKFNLIEDLLSRGVLLQINTNSITGYYSRQAQQMAFELIDRKWVHFLGSDCHHMPHIEVMDKARQHKYYLKALDLDLLNNSI